MEKPLQSSVVQAVSEIKAVSLLPLLVFSKMEKSYSQSTDSDNFMKRKPGRREKKDGLLLFRLLAAPLAAVDFPSRMETRSFSMILTARLKRFPVLK